MISTIFRHLNIKMVILLRSLRKISRISYGPKIGQDIILMINAMMMGLSVLPVKK